MEITDELSCLGFVRLRILALRLSLGAGVDRDTTLTLADEALAAIDLAVAAEIGRALRASKRPLAMGAPEGCGGLLVVEADDGKTTIH